MQSNSPTMGTLYETMLGDRLANRPLRLALTVLGGSALIALSSKFQVPFWPVPMTMQTLVILGLSMALGWRLAGLTLLAYLAEGAAGLPVFAGTPEKGLGLAYMVGPTGGYILGFLLAALLCGWLAERGWDRNPLTTMAAMLLGNIAIYVPGVLWLGTLVGWDKPVLDWGLYPFLAGDFVKLLLAAALLPACWKLARRLRG